MFESVTSILTGGWKGMNEFFNCRDSRFGRYYLVGWEIRIYDTSKSSFWIRGWSLIKRYFTLQARELGLLSGSGCFLRELVSEEISKSSSSLIGPLERRMTFSSLGKRDKCTEKSSSNDKSWVTSKCKDTICSWRKEATSESSIAWMSGAQPELYSSLVYCHSDGMEVREWRPLEVCRVRPTNYWINTCPRLMTWFNLRYSAIVIYISAEGEHGAGVGTHREDPLTSNSRPLGSLWIFYYFPSQNSLYPTECRRDGQQALTVQGRERREDSQGEDKREEREKEGERKGSWTFCKWGRKGLCSVEASETKVH